MVDGGRHSAEDRVGEGVPLADGDGGELRPVGHVADGVDRGHAGAGVFVDGDGAVLPERDACRLQSQARRIGRPAGGEHDGAERRIDAVGEADGDVLAGLPEAEDVGLVDDRDAARLEPGFEADAQVFVETAQHALAAIDDGGGHTQARKDRRELGRNEATALDEDRVGQPVEMKCLVRGDAEFLARNAGTGARCDQNGLRGELATRFQQPDAVGSGHDGAVADDLDAGPLEAGDIGGLEPGDLLVLVGDERRPVEAGGADVPAEARSKLEQVLVARGIDEELLGHAAADHAGAADAILLDDRDPGTIAGRDTRGTHAARASADHQEVIAVAHRKLPKTKRPRAVTGPSSDRHQDVRCRYPWT